MNEVKQRYVEITEEPQTDGYRFRYENEGRYAARIKGVNSTVGNTTYPTIKIHGYEGLVYVYISLITLHGHYPHPHKLTGEDCKDGVFRKLIKVSEKESCFSFSDLRIQCVKKKDVKESLKSRQRRRIDPFGTGFSHSSDLNKINFNAVRLCFQVLLPDSNGEFFNPFPLKPVISKPIYDSKSISNMAIMKLSHCTASVEGGQDVILLCGQVNKDDIEIIFYEEKDQKIIWSAYGQFSPHDVHRKVAISFKTPIYKILNVQEKINCFIYLRRPSDGTIGRPRKFTLLPIKKDPEAIVSKRRKFDDTSSRIDFQSNPFCSVIPADIPPRTLKTAVRREAVYDNVDITPRAIQSTVRRDATNHDVDITPRAKQSTLTKQATHNNGIVNQFDLRCNSGSKCNPLPSVSVLGNGSYVQNGSLFCDNLEKQASTTTRNPNIYQLVDRVCPADSENIQLNKAIAFEDPHENDMFEILSKDVDPNQSDSNENMSSISVDTNGVLSGLNLIFDFIDGKTSDAPMLFQNNARLLSNSDAGDPADNCLDMLSSLSLDSNSKDLDVTMRDQAKDAFSEAVGISISVSS